MTSFVPALLGKVTLILVIGLMIAATMRRASPSLRHLVLLATLGASLALPAVMLISPEWRVRILPPRLTNVSRGPTAPGRDANPTAHLPTVTAPIPQSDLTVTAQHDANASARTGPSSANRSLGDAELLITGASGDADLRTSRGSGNADLRTGNGWGDADLPIVPLVWLLGFVAVLGWLAIGRLRLRQIAATSWPLREERWARILTEERAAAGVTKPVRLASSPAVSTPLTWGWRFPIVLLPEDALDWPDPHRSVVIRHELAHVARADSLSQLLAGITCALYWFHPLVWLAERRMRVECERACDDTVVAHGTPAAEYAAHLLEVARSARAFGAAGFLSVAMARPSQLEGRLIAVLNGSGRKTALARGAKLIAGLIALALLLPLAAFRPVARPEPAAAMRAPVVNVYAAAATPEPRAVAANAGEVTKKVPADTETPDVTKYAPVLTETPEESSVARTVARQLASADSTFQLSVPARNGGTLALDLKTGGTVVINSWDRPEVLVRAALGGRDWARTRVTLTESEDGARLYSYYAGSSNNQSSSHVFNITVPRNYDVRVSSAGGAISLTGLNGRFTGNTGGGEITIRNTRGETRLSTGGGAVRVTDSHLNGTVSTGGGTVRIEGVTGDFSGSSGGGPVIVTNVGGTTISSSGGANVVAVGNGEGSGKGVGSGSGRSSSTVTTSVDNGSGSASAAASGGISMNSAGGSLNLPSAPNGARVTTGGGAISIGSSGGNLYASTGGGPITIGPSRGSVRAHTGAGDVTIELEGPSGHTVDATSGNGDVTLIVPRDLDAVLDLESAYTNNFGRKTRIVSDIPVQVTETQGWDDRQGTPRRYVRARQIVGKGGPVIRVRTVNGDVIVRRKN